MNIIAILLWLKNHWRIAANAILVASVASLVAWGVHTHKQNQKLARELEMVQNNVEAY